MRLGAAGYLALLLVGLVALFLSALFAITVGAADVSITDLIAGRAPEATRQILLDIRLPRILGAMLVGSCLAVVGASLQAVMRNPLADPYILGISAGASVGAALAVIFGLLAGGSVLAFGTALASVAVVYRVAKIDGRLPPLRLLLAGVALSSFASAVTGFLLYLAPEATAVRGVLFWLMGGLGAADWRSLGWAALLALPASAALVMTARWQTLLLLGDETATAIGLDVARARRWLIGLTAIVTGALVAFAGAIGFVGLIVPHALRPFTGPDHRRLLPAGAIYGALLLIAMDTIARTMMAPEELPVGILSGLLGAPFFLALLARFEGGRSD